MLGQAYCFIIFVFICGGLEILFVIAFVCILCVGCSRMCARSCRACTGLDRHLTCGVGSRVLRAVPCTSVLGHQYHTVELIYTKPRPRPGFRLAQVLSKE